MFSWLDFSQTRVYILRPEPACRMKLFPPKYHPLSSYSLTSSSLKTSPPQGPPIGNQIYKLLGDVWLVLTPDHYCAKGNKGVTLGFKGSPPLVLLPRYPKLGHTTISAHPWAQNMITLKNRCLPLSQGRALNRIRSPPRIPGRTLYSILIFSSGLRLMKFNSPPPFCHWCLLGIYTIASVQLFYRHQQNEKVMPIMHNA